MRDKAVKRTGTVRSTHYSGSLTLKPRPETGQDPGARKADGDAGPGARGAMLIRRREKKNQEPSEHPGGPHFGMNWYKDRP